MAKTLALFDFDNTLYAKDSLLEFTKFHKGNRAFGVGILRLFPYLCGLKLRLLNNEKVKLKYFAYFFRNTDSEVFSAAAKTFALENIPKSLNPKVFAEFRKHLDSGHDVYIVTASPADWIAPWSAAFGVPVIGTKLDIENGKITGKFNSANCFGPEKVNRIKEIVDLDGYDSIVVYGSGKGDSEMLKLRRN